MSYTLRACPYNKVERCEAERQASGAVGSGSAADAELTAHLGYAPHVRHGTTDGNARNGTGKKTVQMQAGPLDLVVPRDRNGSFAPQLVKKRQRRLEGFDDKVLSLYARGLSTRDIQGHLAELYGTEVSPTLIFQEAALARPKGA